MSLLIRYSKLFLLSVLFLISFGMFAEPGKNDSSQILKLSKADSIAVTKDTLPHNIDTIIHLRTMKPDALLTFIKDNGKDSLMRFINNEITATRRMLINVNSEELDPYTSMVLRLINRHFNLGIDSLIIAFGNPGDLPMKLYGTTTGNYNQYVKGIDSLKKTNANLYDLFVKSMDNKGTRMGLALFGNSLDVSDKLFDALYQYAVKQKMSEKIETYWIFAEYMNSIKEKKPAVEQIKKQLFDSLYAANSLDKYLGMVYDPKNVNAKYIKFTDPMRFLAYGFYGNDITLKDQGRDLLNLLYMMTPGGGWRLRLSSASAIDINSSVYGLWALCEAREKLKAFE